jgi:hypothetical protein
MMTTLRRSILLTAVTSSILFAGSALADPSVHRATGGGTFLDGGVLNQIAFTAQIDATGAVKGQAEFHLRNNDVFFHIVVDCLSVDGNRAWIGGVISESSDPTLVGQQRVWEVVDNGEPAPPDQVSVPIPGSPGACNNHPAIPLLDLTNGNVQVQ